MEAAAGWQLAHGVSRTKLRVARQPLMERPRLVGRLDDGRDARLFLLQAPAGYGKSSLLQQWSSYLALTGSTVAWLSLDASDREPALFARRLLRALEQAGVPPELRLSQLLSLEGNYSARVVITAMASGFAGGLAPIYIMVDDAQHLKGSDAFACLKVLLDVAPPQLKLVVATREGLDLPLDRLRAIGEMIELKAEDLRFSLAETAFYLAREGHQDLGHEDIALVQKRTEGWAAGLKLFCMALRGDRDYAQVLESFSGELRQVADFFVEDVLSQQSPELQEFILLTSVLDWLSPALCDYVLDIRNSRDLIDRCEGSGLFLIELDNTRTAYRYHHLFAEHLRRTLHDRSPSRADQLCRKASGWLMGEGRHIEAFEYALKGGDPVAAADILDASCESLWARGHQSTVQRLAARIPAHVQAMYPRIMLALAWRLTAQWRLEEARNLVAVSRARLAQLAQGGADPGFLWRQNWLALHRESQIAMAAYDLPALEAHTTALIQDAAAIDDPYLLASCHNSLQYAQREQYRLANVEKLEALAGEYRQNTGSAHGLIFAAAISGPSYLLLGRTDRAIEVLSDGLAVAREWAGDDAPIGSIAAIPLARVRYECNETDEAWDLLEKYMPLATTAGFVDQLVAGWITRSRLLRMRRDWASARSVLEEAVEFAGRHELERLRIVATAEHVRVLLRMGRPDDAARLARRRGILAHAHSGAANRSRFTTQDGAIALAWCRLVATRDRVNDALGVARQWRSFVVSAQAAHAAVEWEIALSELLLVSGDPTAAKRAMWQAVARAARGRLVRPFLDEGEPVAFLLRRLAKDGGAIDAAAAAFLQVLLEAADAEGLAVGEDAAAETDDDASAIMGQMNSREIQIVTLAGLGLLNRQIGDKLGLTEGTVKWYLQQAFDKLGIRDRVRAAEKVRRLGLTQ